LFGYCSGQGSEENGRLHSEDKRRRNLKLKDSAWGEGWSHKLYWKPVG